MKNRNFFKYFIMIAVIAASVFMFAACSKNEFKGDGAGEISLVLDTVYDGAVIGCPGSEIETVTAGKEYKIKVKSLKRTDVIVSCEGYHTQTVAVNTKDFVNGVAQKNVTLEKRYNTLTLTLSGISDMTGVTVESQNDMIRSQTVSGKKIVLTFKEYDGEGSIDRLSVKCDGYHTFPLDVSKSYFTDYEASMRVSLLSTSSKDTSVTFLNNIGGDGYEFYIYKAVDSRMMSNDPAARVSVTSSATQLLDKNENYYILARDQYNGDDEFYTPLMLKENSSPYVTVALSEIKGIELCKKRSWYGGKQYKATFPSEMRAENVRTFMYNDDNSRLEVNTRERYVSGNNLKAGDTVRIISYEDNYGYRLISCYETEFTGDGFAFETKIDDNVTVKFRFVDKDGKVAKLSEIPDYGIMLFNGQNYDRYFVQGDDSYSANYIDITTPELGVAEKAEDGIVVNIKKMFDLTVKYGTRAGENYFKVGNLYIKKLPIIEGRSPESIEMYRLFESVLGKSTYDIRMRSPLKFQIKLYKYNAEDPDARDYITDLGAVNGGDYTFEYSETAQCYICETAYCESYSVWLTSGYDSSTGISRKSYNELRFIAMEEFYEKDGEYLLIEMPIYEKKEIAVVNSGDPLPNNGYRSVGVYFGGTNQGAYFYSGDKDNNWVIRDFSELLIGREFAISLYDSDTRSYYEASGTVSQEDFENGSIVLNFKKIQEQDTDNRW